VLSDFSNIVFDPAWQSADVALVEAGAGTGKTYNIQNMYLRLVAAQGLKVQEILVVTFTEAATHELRQRLRQILLKCHEYLEGRLPDTDPERGRIEKMLAVPETSDPAGGGAADMPVAERQRLRVRLALTDFDAASVFTIHGFCQRVLDRYAFECGHDPDAELMPDADALIGEVCLDWWRRQHYGAAAAARRMVFKSPAELTGLVREILKRTDAVVLPAGETEEHEADLLAALVDHAERIGADERAGNAPWKIYRGGAVKAAVALSEALSQVRHAVASGDGVDVRAVRGLAEGDVAAAFDPKQPDGEGGLVDTLAKVRQALAARMATVARALAGTVRQRIREASLLTYDAMLTHVRDALHGENGQRLIDALRGEFKAAMVDEFQDTDPVQYAIFRTVFGSPDAAVPLLYVGDPKQAIYGFRNGDIFTYYAASRNVTDGRRYRLATNYRSEEPLVAAVNAFFTDRQTAGDEGTGAFLNANIRYEPLGAKGVDPAKRLQEDGRPDATPLRLWRYTGEGARLPGMDSPVARDMYADVAEEIVRLLSDAATRIGARAVSPSDIAVLVMTHAEAERIQHELASRGVNVERQSTGCIFDTDEARQMGLVMQAMLTPRDPAAVRAALCTDFFPCSEEDIRRFADDRVSAGSDAFDVWLERFRAAGERWAHGSFIQAFRLLAERAGMRAHLLHGGEGARAVTNVLHLAELAHQAALAMQLSPPGLLRWFVRQLDQDSRDPDDEHAKVRPSSDDEAVKVMTVFKSKGLEFPIVFVPTLWRRQPAARRGGEPWLAYHGEVCADGTAPLVLNLAIDDMAGVQAAQAEREQEDVRLAYVALTRAVNRCYLLAVDGAGGGTALQRLIERLATQVDALAAMGIRQDAGPLYPGQVTRWDPAGEQAVRVMTPDACGLPLPVIPVGGGHASFSSLMPHDVATPPEAGAQDVDAVDRDTTGEAAAVSPEAMARTDIFAIRAGAKTGNCWHSIFERIDFQADDGAIDAVVDEALDQYGICGWPATDVRVQQRRQAVRAMVRRVLAAPLSGGFCLADVPLRARRSELQFHFTLRQHGAAQTMRGIHDALEQHWQGDGRDETFLRRLDKAGHSLPLGFMTGYMDLVFQQGERFYIVDWKSNRIGGTPESFDASGLAGEMAAHGYYLQYLIYTVALDAFLRQRLAGYDYERHMGGAYYIFLRGVDDAVPGRGIFHERPSASLIDALARVLAAAAG
jgi:exodeoxyribonuclease V beta subunit